MKSFVVYGRLKWDLRREKRLDDFLDLRLGVSSCDLLDDLAALEKEESRDGRHAVSRSRAGIIVDVDLGYALRQARR
jgi:hypothetical protein